MNRSYSSAPMVKLTGRVYGVARGETLIRAGGAGLVIEPVVRCADYRVAAGGGVEAGARVAAELDEEWQPAAPVDRRLHP